MNNKFKFFCEICENISLTNSRIEKTDILFEYLILVRSTFINVLIK